MTRNARTAAALLLACALGARTELAAAQCGAPASSCRQCHEVEGKRPPDAVSVWHADHAFGDFCAGCHGGDPTIHDEARAHLDLVDPLAAAPRRCAGCHPGNASVAVPYLAARAAPGPPRAARSSEPPRSSPATEERREEGASAPVTPAAARTSPGANAALALVAALIAIGGGALVARRERRRQGSAPASIRAELARGEWSPYSAGALLGVVVTVSMALFGHRLSGGGAYQQIAAPLGRLLDPGSVYFRLVLPPSARWELVGLVGAVLGALAASLASGTFALRTMPDAQWTVAFGPSLARRWLVGFIGAALTEIAAGVAGGCTASLAVSGGAALAPGAFAFMAGMFAGGIPTAWLVHRGGRR
jgi:hypothetical protein